MDVESATSDFIVPGYGTACADAMRQRQRLLRHDFAAFGLRRREREAAFIKTPSATKVISIGALLPITDSSTIPPPGVREFINRTQH